MNNFFHVNPPEQRGSNRDKKSRVTFAGVYQDNTLRIGKSFCHSVDQFCRRTGRIKAEGNALSKNPVLIVDVSHIDERNRNDYFVQLCRQFCDENNIKHDYQRRKKNKKRSEPELVTGM